MSGLEEIFHPDAAEARRLRDVEKELPAPAPVPGEPIRTADGSEVVIPAVASPDAGPQS